MQSGAYAAVVTAVVLASYVVKIRTDSIGFYLLDSLSLAVFISVGVLATVSQNFPLFVAFGMGALTGIGGGLIRDAITSQHPQALSDPAYPLMIASGTIGSVMALHFGLQPWVLSCALVLLVTLISLASRRKVPAVVPERVAQSQPDTPASVNHPSPTIFRRSPVSYTIKALCILIPAAAAGLYLFSSDHGAAVAKPATSSTVATESKQFDELITLAKWQLDNHNAAGADKVIEEAKRLNPTHYLVHSLYAECNELKRYLNNLATIKNAISSDDLDTAEAALTSAEPYKRHHPEFKQLKETLVAKSQKKQLAAKEKALDAASMQRHLNSARQHLKSNNLDSALAEVAAAESYGISNPDLRKLKSSIQHKIAVSARQLKAQDIDFAQQQFWKLKRAVELKNLGAISQLTARNQQLEALFEQLFDRYVQIDVQLTDITTDKQTAYTTLELQKMRLPDGNINFPPSQYGSIPLSLNRTKESWSKIKW